MLESVLGSETFLAGLRLYLQRHQYSNAETSDLWAAMTEQVHMAHHGSCSMVCCFLFQHLLLNFGKLFHSTVFRGLHLTKNVNVVTEWPQNFFCCCCACQWQSLYQYQLYLSAMLTVGVPHIVRTISMPLGLHECMGK